MEKRRYPPRLEEEKGDWKSEREKASKLYHIPGSKS